MQYIVCNNNDIVTYNIILIIYIISFGNYRNQDHDFIARCKDFTVHFINIHDVAFKLNTFYGRHSVHALELLFSFSLHMHIKSKFCMYMPLNISVFHTI